jgi:hypothetical protein
MDYTALYPRSVHQILQMGTASGQCTGSHCSISEAISDVTSFLFSRFGSVQHCSAPYCESFTESDAFWVTGGDPAAYVTLDKVISDEAFQKYFKCSRKK